MIGASVNLTGACAPKVSCVTSSIELRKIKGATYKNLIIDFKRAIQLHAGIIFMTTDLKYLGVSAFEITSETGIRVLIDPFITGNPMCPVTLDSVKGADMVLVTMGPEIIWAMP